MGKISSVVLVAAGVVTGGFYFRHALEPLANNNLPAPVAHVVIAAVHANESLVYTLSPVLEPFLKPFGIHLGGGHGGGHAATKGPADKSDAKGGGEAKGGAPKGGPGAAKGGVPPAPVTVAIAQLATMPVVLSAPGTVEAMATVGIKPRVDGAVIEVGFKEGDMVTEGSMLYRLDDRLVRAQIKQAEAAVARDRASLKDAESILDRRETLLRNKFASEAQTETARQQVEVLKASISASLASVEAQKTQLDYLTIRAPITGRTGSITAKLGTFVRSADLLPLLTINQTKPIAVSFALPQSNLDALKTALKTKSTAVITVPGTKPFKVNGVLNFVDNQVDKTTGTVTGKVMVENPNEELWPGQAVGVDLTVENRADMIAIPASAIQPAQQGMIAWVLADTGTVSIRNVKQDRVIDQLAYISEGLKAGEKVVTDGQLRLGPGARVNVRETLTPQLPGQPPAAAPAAAPAGSKSGQVSGEPKLPAADAVTSEPKKNKRG